VAQKPHSPTRHAYFVEHYLPGQRIEQLTRSAARIRACVSEMESAGEPITYVRSTIVPNDEAVLCVIEAASEELVGEAYARAGLSFDRISAAISPDDERSKAP
jgi:hypothetical protein